MLALFVACLCHDIDHRGTNNSFQVRSYILFSAFSPSLFSLPFLFSLSLFFHCMSFFSLSRSFFIPSFSLDHVLFNVRPNYLILIELRPLSAFSSWTFSCITKFHPGKLNVGVLKNKTAQLFQSGFHQRENNTDSFQILFWHPGRTSDVLT